MLMKKILLSLFTLMVSLAAFAQTEYKFDDASAWGNFTNPAAGEFAQVESGTAITNGNLKIEVTFPEGKNGARFFAAQNGGAINLRVYVESTVTFSTVDGSAMSAVEFSGTNLGATYLTGEGYENGKWSGNANSFTIKCIKSTVQINSLKVYSAGQGPVDISNTPATAYTVTEALALIEKGEGLSAKVYVKGEIKEVQELSIDYGNATYVITDGKSDLLVYRGYGLKGNRFTADGDIQDGDEVIVYGQLVDFKGTKEFTTGSQIYSLNGKTDVDTPDTPVTPEEPYTIVGAGTLDNPYTIEDVIKGVYNAEQTVEGVWVKGVILGCFGSEKEPISAKEPVASNIALGTEDKAFVIPVQLLANNATGDSPARKALNIVDNPENVGKTVWVYGDITKYFSVAGVKSTSDWSWDGQTSSVESIKVSSMSTRNAIYSVSGAKLNNAPVKGVYIIDGKKKVVK